MERRYAYRNLPGQLVYPASRCPAMVRNRTHWPGGYLLPVLPLDIIQTEDVGST
jgi:hypothetical protein